MAQFVKVGSRTEFEDLEGGKLVEADGHRIAVFNVGGNYYAIENACPHRGGPLAEGLMAGEEVICPWHGLPIQRENRFSVDPAGATRRQEPSRPDQWRRCGSRGRFPERRFITMTVVRPSKARACETTVDLGREADHTRAGQESARFQSRLYLFGRANSLRICGGACSRVAENCRG